MEEDNLEKVRVKIDWLDERLISRLKDRSRFLQNNYIYQTDGIDIGRKGISFLEFAIEGLEGYHSSLGRYRYPEQVPIIKPTGKDVLCTKNEIIEFYRGFIKFMCREGEDSLTFGETAYCDADLLEMTNERINLGRFVAESKLDADPLIIVNDSAQTLEKRLRNKEREEEVIKKVKLTAMKYELDTGCAEKFFKWVIDKTVSTQIRYLQSFKS